MQEVNKENKRPLTAQIKRVGGQKVVQHQEQFISKEVKTETQQNTSSIKLNVTEDMIEKIKKNKNIFFNSGKTKIRKIENDSEKQSQKNFGLIVVSI